MKCRDETEQESGSTPSPLENRVQAMQSEVQLPREVLPYWASVDAPITSRPRIEKRIRFSEHLWGKKCASCFLSRLFLFNPHNSLR